MPRATLFDPEHSLVTWETAESLSRNTGLKPETLATFRVKRLALHEVLIRVTVDTHVPDGPNYADLGINLRGTAERILDIGVMPQLPAIEAEMAALKTSAEAILGRELDAHIFQPPPLIEERKSFFGLVSRKVEVPQTLSLEERALAAVTAWKAAADPDALTASCQRALAQVVGTLMGHRGSLAIPRDLLIALAANLVWNDRGSALVSLRVAPLFERACKELGVLRLPPQKEPVILNAKGASASGKSTIRGQQRQIAERLGLDWGNFAIISPDYWRKLLIDYDGLGDDFKYAAMLTGRELAIIDAKLDTYMADKARHSGVPHMLIDRFRFDSFQSTSRGAADSTLLSRFGSKLFLFFLITPPAETVTRAWKRGLQTGRYKAVDDLLYHNVEAYSGMPDLFFSWAKTRDKWIHYEFLDNSVPAGDVPRSIAFGANGRLVIADLEAMCSIMRFQHVNLGATCADEVLQDDLSDEDAMAFARRAFAELDAVDVLTPGSTHVFLKCRDSRIVLNPAGAPRSVPLSAFGPHETVETALGEITEDDRAHVIGSFAA